MLRRLAKIHHIKLYILVTVVVIAIGIFLIWHSPTNSSVTSGTAKNVGLSPAASSGEQISNRNKTSPPLSSSTSSSPPSTSKQSVTPVITNQDPSNVHAYIPGLIEDGGTCSVTFTQGTTSKSGSSIGVSNVSDTVCPGIDVTDVGSGNWTLTFTYNSSTAQGSVTKQVSL